jgi:hypothetical protein
MFRKSGPSRPLSLVINLANLKAMTDLQRPKPSIPLRLYHEILSIKGKNSAIPRIRKIRPMLKKWPNGYVSKRKFYADFNLSLPEK